MKLLNVFIISVFLLIGVSANATNYRIISLDIKLNANDINIKFSPSIYKEEAVVSYRRCPTCEFEDRIFTNNTEYMVKGFTVNFQEFKKAVFSYKANPPARGYKVYLSNDIRNNEIFSIELDIAG